ncbi:MAG TPA: NUDIX hydrolase [Gemmatimonadota bacterium]|nr:NUDIX hydrolase [Gemmatimonadota bacterium]
MKVDWERIGRELVFEGRVIEVFRDMVRTRRDGAEREAVYDLVHHPGAAAVVPLHADGTVSLLHQFRYALGREIWEIPAGTIEEGEPFLECASRELEEETGYRAAHWTELATFHPSPGFCDEELRVFLAEDLSEGSGVPEPDEHLETARIPLTEALDWIEAGRIVDAKSIIGLLRARERLVAEGRWPPVAGGADRRGAPA